MGAKIFLITKAQVDELRKKMGTIAGINKLLDDIVDKQFIEKIEKKHKLKG
jgi:hypothetical protein